MDIEAISKTIIRNLKTRIIGKSDYGNKEWEKADSNWYNGIHNQNNQLHDNFVKYLQIGSLILLLTLLLFYLIMSRNVKKVRFI